MPRVTVLPDTTESFCFWFSILSAASALSWDLNGGLKAVPHLLRGRACLGPHPHPVSGKQEHRQETGSKPTYEKDEQHQSNMGGHHKLCVARERSV